MISGTKFWQIKFNFLLFFLSCVLSNTWHSDIKLDSVHFISGDGIIQVSDSDFDSYLAGLQTEYHANDLIPTKPKGI